MGNGGGYRRSCGHHSIHTTTHARFRFQPYLTCRPLVLVPLIILLLPSFSRPAFLTTRPARHSISGHYDQTNHDDYDSHTVANLTVTHHGLTLSLHSGLPARPLISRRPLEADPSLSHSTSTCVTHIPVAGFALLSPFAILVTPYKPALSGDRPDQTAPASTSSHPLSFISGSVKNKIQPTYQPGARQ